MSEHLTEEQVAAIADGQRVGAGPLGHLDGCEACSLRVADHALAAREVHVVLRALAETPVAATDAALAAPIKPRSSAPSPIAPLLVGTAVAIAASVPLLPGAARTLSLLLAGGHDHAEALDALARSVFARMREPGFSIATTACLVVCAAVVATVASRRASRSGIDSEEGARR